MSTDAGANLAAARELLATLSAGRAALLQLAGSHLPFASVLALHRMLPPPEAASAPWEGASMLRERLAREVGIRDLGPAPITPVRQRQPEASSRPKEGRPSRRSSDSRSSESVAQKVEKAARVELPSPPVVDSPRPGLAMEAPAEAPPATEGPVAADSPLPEVAEPLVAASPSEEPTSPEEAPAISGTPRPGDAAEGDGASAEPLFVDVGDKVLFSGSGENTANWGLREPVSLSGLLSGAPRPDDDHTQIAPAPVLPVSSELSEWAANVLGGRPAHSEAADVLVGATESTGEVLPEGAVTPLASEPTAGELSAPKVIPARLDTEADSRPMLREPRVMGVSSASLDVRAAARGVAPRVARLDEIEVGAEEGDLPEPGEEQGDGDGNFQVTFEQSAAIRTRPRVPRLTDDDDSAGPTHPTLSVEQATASVVVDDKQIQSLMDDAAAHAKKGELLRAIQAYTDALDMRPTLTEAHIGRGRCHLELGDYSSAMSDFARAEDLAPDKPESHVATGDLYFARKEYKRAIEFYDQAVEIDGSHAMARCRRGISHYYRKNYRQAAQDLQRALDLDREIPNIKKYVQMAQKKLERGD